MDYEAVADKFDKVDKVIEMDGHIIGMGLSPDHRYLYVHSGPWPSNYVISNPHEPPPIARELNIQVIDLSTLEKVSHTFQTHKAYEPNVGSYYIFLDVCDNYLARFVLRHCIKFRKLIIIFGFLYTCSGAEETYAYVWDRYYGIPLARNRHKDVVNSVAFNPKDSEMLVTVSDDNTIKV